MVSFARLGTGYHSARAEVFVRGNGLLLDLLDGCIICKGPMIAANRSYKMQASSLCHWACCVAARGVSYHFFGRRSYILVS